MKNHNNIENHQVLHCDRTCRMMRELRRESDAAQRRYDDEAPAMAAARVDQLTLEQRFEWIGYDIHKVLARLTPEHSAAVRKAITDQAIAEVYEVEFT